MVSHLVALKPRPNLTPSERRDFLEAFDRAVHEIPTVRGVRIGRRVTHGAGYEQQMPDTADFVAILDFDDVAGLRAYLAHPAHQRLGQLFGEVLSSALIYDFEIAGGLAEVLKEWSS
jgi:hypothetical protein